MPNRYVSLVVAAVLLTVTGCREIVPPAADMGGGSDMGVDMEVPEDMGPCSPVCRSSEVCDPDADGGPACVGCLGDTNCSGGRKCDLETNSCVACLEDADCTLPATAQCNLTTHTCVACSTNTQCAQFAATPVCATEGCVECTHEFQEACAGNVCNSTQHECTDRAPHTVDICGECVSDDDCLAGQVCVHMEFGDPGVTVGNFCLFRKSTTGDGAPNDDCNSVRAFTHEQNVTTLDEETHVVVCTPGTITTCPALNDYRTQTCDGETPAGHAQCGAESLDDGYCTAAHLCTTACGVTADCKTGGTCSGTSRCT